MTAFEFFKNQYNEYHECMIKSINTEVPIDSFKFVEIAWEYFFGGTCKVDNWYNINGVDDTQEMIEKGYLRKWDDRSWKARQLGKTRHVELTKKGLRAFYKTMF